MHQRTMTNGLIVSAFANSIFFSIFKRRIYIMKKFYIASISTFILIYNTNRTMYLRNYDNLFSIIKYEIQKQRYIERKNDELIKKSSLKKTTR